MNHPLLSFHSPTDIDPANTARMLPMALRTIASGIDPADTARLVPLPAGARARSAARALSGRAAPRLPAARRAALEQTLMEHFNVSELSAALLGAAVDEPISRPRDDFSPPEVRLM